MSLTKAGSVVILTTSKRGHRAPHSNQEVKHRGLVCCLCLNYLESVTHVFNQTVWNAWSPKRQRGGEGRYSDHLELDWIAGRESSLQSLVMRRRKLFATLLLLSICLSDAAKPTRWPASKTTTTTAKPLYQGYLAFMLLCEPDSKCIPMETKIDVINCLESGMSLAAVYVYKQCTGQGVLTCDDENISQTVKNCLKMQSGSFTNLITDSSRQCIREKVTLGNIDCYKSNQRLRKGGQKLWMQGGKLLPSASSYDQGTRIDREAQRPVSIFEYAAIVKTSTPPTPTTTSTTTTTTTTTTTPAPHAMGNPNYPAYDNGYSPFYANPGNNYQQGNHHANSNSMHQTPNQNSFPAGYRVQQQSFPPAMRFNSQGSQYPMVPMPQSGSGGYANTNNHNGNSNGNRNRNKATPASPVEDVYEYIEYEEDDVSDSREASTTTRKPNLMTRRMKTKTTRRFARQSTTGPQEDAYYAVVESKKRPTERKPVVRADDYEEDIIRDPHSVSSQSDRFYAST